MDSIVLLLSTKTKQENQCNVRYWVSLLATEFYDDIGCSPPAYITINVPVVFMAQYVMMLHTSKPLRISAIKTTGTLVVLCTRVLLCTVVVCCCLLLCVVVCCCVLEGWGVAVLCEQVFRGWGLVGRAPPPPPYSVGIHGCLLVGGGVL
jgi:hypothetical protein